MASFVSKYMRVFKLALGPAQETTCCDSTVRRFA